MNLINKLFIYLIKFYRIAISPLTKNNCRYYPTCSQYSLSAFKRFNFFKALWLSSKRILKCNPFFKGGFDYLPKNKKE